MNNNVIVENKFSFDIIERCYSADSLRAYLKINYSSISGKLAVAKASQIKTKFTAFQNESTPYELLNTKNRMKHLGINIRSKININKSEHFQILVGHTGLFAFHFYLLEKLNEIHSPDFIKQRTRIFNYILFFINEYKNLNKMEFISLFKSKINEMEVPKGKISSEFFELVQAFILLSADVIIKHYDEYSQWCNDLKSYLNSSLIFKLEFDLYKSRSNVGFQYHIIKAKTAGTYLVDLTKPLDHLGLYSGYRLSTIDGDGTVLGIDHISNEKLWIQLDNDIPLASCYVISSIADLKKILKSNAKALRVHKLSSKLVRQHVSENNINNIPFEIKINANTIISAQLDISPAPLSKFGVSFLDCIQSINGKEIIIGTYNHDLVTLYENHSQYAYLRKNLQSYKIVNNETFVNQGIINILDSIYRQAASFLINYNNDLSFSNFDENIFNRLNYYFYKMYAKTFNESDKQLHERLVIFNSILDFLKTSINSNEDYSIVLKKNIEAMKIPQGLISKGFYQLINTLTEIPYHHLKKDYLSYVEKLQQNTDFMIYNNKLLVKLFKMINNSDNEVVNNNLNEISPPENVQSIFFPYKYSNVEKNEFFNIKNTPLSVFDSYFSELVITTDDTGFVLGAHNHNIVVYWNNLNQSEKLVLKFYPTCDFNFIHVKNDFEITNINSMIQFLLKLKEHVYRTTVMVDEKINFNFDIITDKYKNNKYKLFDAKFNINEKLSKIYESKNTQTYDCSQISFYNL